MSKRESNTSSEHLRFVPPLRMTVSLSFGAIFRFVSMTTSLISCGISSTFSISYEKVSISSIHFVVVSKLDKGSLIIISPLHQISTRSNKHVNEEKLTKY